MQELELKIPNFNELEYRRHLISDEKTCIHYTLVGEIYIPNLVSADTNYEIGV